MVCEVDAFPFLLIWELLFLVCVELALGLGFFEALGFAILILFGVGLRLLLAIEGWGLFLGQPLGFDRCLSWCEAVEFAEEDL